ncbi:hypothetical protein BGZ80_005944 [Entomortierella chlamydospora]|uniref:Arm-like repeat domain-containing protein n=1 Tax=Entomortierella chlamydospora TaxID=101097 RepID=A0A9P6N0F3_9FUNG|nr:hypothetical protein BGZ80_005944 [Entomortierella chlamydospora]
MCLAPVLDQEEFRKLLQAFVDSIDDSRVPEANMVDGLVHLMRNPRPRNLDANDLVKLLELVNTRLQDIRDEPTQQIHKLTLAISGVIRNMAGSDIRGLSCVQLHGSFFKHLEGVQSRLEPYLIYQAAYAFQALQYVLDDKLHSKSIQENMEDLLRGIMGVTNDIKDFDFGRLMEELNRIHKTKAKVTKPFIFNMKADSDSKKNLKENLNSNLLTRTTAVPPTYSRGRYRAIQQGPDSKLYRSICVYE